MKISHGKERVLPSDFADWLATEIIPHYDRASVITQQIFPRYSQLLDWQKYTLIYDQVFLQLTYMFGIHPSIGLMWVYN